MHLEEVRRLIRLVEESEIDELEIWKWWGRIKVRKSPGNGVHVSGAGMMPMSAMPPPSAPPAVEPPSKAVEAPFEESPGAEEAGLVAVKSPMVGTFYAAPAADAEPYVQVGDIVEPGQTVCIVEAMKLMNEIQSEVKGKIVRVLGENAKPVEFGQTLYLVKEM
jgi:acetyl-CoA carboxylase biotin carboxyl carrier protein